GESAEEGTAPPAGEGAQPSEGGAPEEVDRPVLQGLRRIRRRENELHIDAFLPEESELDGGDGHEVGRGDRVSNGESHRILSWGPDLNPSVMPRHGERARRRCRSCRSLSRAGSPAPDRAWPAC